MLPTLVDRLQAVAIGIENVGCIIAGIVMQAHARLAVINRSSRHRRIVEGIHLGRTLGEFFPSPIVIGADGEAAGFADSMAIS